MGSPELEQESIELRVGAAAGDIPPHTAADWKCVSEGWRKILPILNVNGSLLLPTAWGSSWHIDAVRLDVEQTKPPARITEPEVLALMESHGIGTDATMQQHLATVVDRGYTDVIVVEAHHGQRWSRYRRELCETRLGKSVLHSMLLMDQTLVLPSVRAEVEKDYMAVAAGTLLANDVVVRRVRQYKTQFNSLFQSMERDKTLFNLLANNRESQRNQGSKKQASARALLAQVSLNDVHRD